MHNMHAEEFPYFHNSTKCIGFIAYDKKHPKPLPGILIAHAWRGQDAFVKEKAIALAKLGYVGFALDIYGEGKHTSSNEEAPKLMAPFFLDRKLLQERAKAGLEALKKHPQVDSTKLGAIGFCFGGLVVYELLRSGADVQAVVCFHGFYANEREGQKAKITPISPHIKGSLLILHGYEDPFVTKGDLQAVQEELNRVKVDWQLHIYGDTMHAFTNPEAQNPKNGTVYHQQSARRAWQAMQDLFKEKF